MTSRRSVATQTLAVVSALVLVLCAISWLRPPLPGGDFLASLRSWDWFRSGGSFHHLPAISPAGLGVRAEVWLTWWSPGTYLPAVWFEALGMTLGHGMTLWLALSTILGLWGWKRLWAGFGFDDVTVAVCLALTLCSWHTLYSFRIVQGGECARFCVFPWLWLWLQAQPAGTWRHAVVLGAATVLAGLAKLAMLPAMVGLGLLGAWEARRWPALLRLGLGGLAGVAVLKLAWLSHGTSPASAGGLDLSQFGTLSKLGIAWVLPAFGVFAQTSMAGRICDALHWAHPEENVLWLTLAVAAATALYVAAWRAVPHPGYRRALVAIGVTVAGSLAIMYLLNAAVSFEDRHARDASLLLLPALVVVARRSVARGIRAALTAGLAAAAAWGVASLAIVWLKPAPVVGPRGLALWKTSSAVVAEVQRLAAQGDPGEPVFAVPYEEEVSELAPHARVFLFSEIAGARLGPNPPPLVVCGPIGAAGADPLALFPGTTARDWSTHDLAGWRWSVHRSRP